MSGEVTIEVIITNDERGSTTVSRSVNLSPNDADIEPRSPEEAREVRMRRETGAAVRLDTIAREAAAVAVSLHLI